VGVLFLFCISRLGVCTGGYAQTEETGSRKPEQSNDWQLLPFEIKNTWGMFPNEAYPAFTLPDVKTKGLRKPRRP
jgi:hypothetical protein